MTLRVLMLCCVLLCCSACQNAAMESGTIQYKTSSTVLGQPNTNRLHVLALKNSSGHGAAPLDLLHTCLVDSLREVGYQPADSSQADGAAEFALELIEWNDRQLASHGLLEMEMALTVLDPQGELILREYVVYATSFGPSQAREMGPEGTERAAVARVGEFLSQLLPEDWLAGN